MTTRPKGPRVHPICPRCNQRHHQWAYCADGVRRVKSAPAFYKGDPRIPGGAVKRQMEARAAAKAAAQTADASIAEVSADTAREELRTLAASLPEGSQQRRSLELLLARDQAREQHQRDEAAAKTRDPAARLPVPTVLRETSEERGRHLNLEMDRLIFAAGSRPTQQNLAVEAAAVHDTLAALPARREQQATKEKEARRPPAHMNGEQPWLCHGCRTRFHSGTLEQVRRRAAAEPGWRVACPSCGSTKVELAPTAAVA